MEDFEDEFEWDDEKNRRNMVKHGVSFEESVTVFDDPNALTILDTAHSTEDEDRFWTIGTSYRQRVLLVVHCDRGDKMRLISARQAPKQERERYEKGILGTR